MLHFSEYGKHTVLCECFRQNVVVLFYLKCSCSSDPRGLADFTRSRLIPFALRRD